MLLTYLKIDPSFAENAVKANKSENVIRKKSFLMVCAEIHRRAVMNAPVGKWFGGTLRRSGYPPQEVEDSDSKYVLDVGFNAPHAAFVHENTHGVTIRPQKAKALYIPLTRAGAKGWRESLEQGKDYIFRKSAKIKPNPKAKYLTKAIDSIRRTFAGYFS